MSSRKLGVKFDKNALNISVMKRAAKINARETLNTRAHKFCNLMSVSKNDKRHTVS